MSVMIGLTGKSKLRGQWTAKALDGSVAKGGLTSSRTRRLGTAWTCRVPLSLPRPLWPQR